MALTEKDHKLIDDILLNKLSEQKSIEAKKRVENDFEFSQELKSRLSMIKSLQQPNPELKKEFKQMLNLSKNKSSPNNISFIKIAASLLALITVSLVIWNIIPSKGERLFNSFYTPYPEPTVLRNSQTSVELNDAFESYSNKDYKIALDKFLKLPDDSLELNLYIGNCYLQLGEVNKAENTFRSDNSEYYKWYLSFTYLKMNKLDMSSILFKELIDNSPLYEIKARNILQKLE